MKRLRRDLNWGRAYWTPVALVLVTALAGLLGAAAQSPAATATPGPIGGQTDDHGCLVGAGYSWCDTLNECVRLWVTPCPSDATNRAANCATELDDLINQGKCASVFPNGTVQEPGLVGAYCPQCDGAGLYLAEQCWGSTG